MMMHYLSPDYPSFSGRDFTKIYKEQECVVQISVECSSSGVLAPGLSWVFCQSYPRTNKKVKP